MTIAVACLYTPNIREMGEIAETNRKRYCQLHNYEWRCCYESLNTSIHPVWSKLLWLISLMQENKYVWIQWTDADSLVMNMQITLEGLIPQNEPTKNIVASKDLWTGFNAGQFLIRSCKWSEQFLKDAYNLHKKYDCHTYREQEAMRITLSEEVVQWIPKRLINSYVVPLFGHQYVEGDFIIHFAGLGYAKALNYMKMFSSEQGVQKYVYTKQGGYLCALILAVCLRPKLWCVILLILIFVMTHATFFLV